MAIKIKPVKRAAKGHNRYCGPAALSIVAGIDTAQAAALIRKVGNVRAVRGTSNAQLIGAFNKLGYQLRALTGFNPLGCKDNPTLAAWLRQTHGQRGDKVFLISAGCHWQIVQGNRYCCGVSKDVVGLKHDAVKRRARVKGVWEIELAGDKPRAIEDVLDPHGLASYEAKYRRAENRARRQVRKLAAQYTAITVERETYCDGGPAHIWVTVDFADETVDVCHDPFEGEHIADGWQDALERVEAYVKLIEEKPHLIADGHYSLEQAA